jgi:hypothetical protein
VAVSLLNEYSVSLRAISFVSALQSPFQGEVAVTVRLGVLETVDPLEAVQVLYLSLARADRIVAGSVGERRRGNGSERMTWVAETEGTTALAGLAVRLPLPLDCTGTVCSGERQADPDHRGSCRATQDSARQGGPDRR